MVFITKILAIALNLVEILLATLDMFVQDSCGSDFATQTSCELLDFEIFCCLFFRNLWAI
jgi:hypothetical protein